MSKSTTSRKSRPAHTAKRANRKAKNAKRSLKQIRAFGNDQKNRTVNASAEFRKAFAAGKEMVKSTAVARLVRRGLKAATVASYIVWAKRDVAGSPDHANPWGFRLVESVNAKGDKTLTRVELSAPAELLAA